MTSIRCRSGGLRGNPLDFGTLLIQYCSSISYLTRFTQTLFFEVVMKWACLKMPDPCLPRANA